MLLGGSDNGLPKSAVFFQPIAHTGLSADNNETGDGGGGVLRREKVTNPRLSRASPGALGDAGMEDGWGGKGRGCFEEWRGQITKTIPLLLINAGHEDRLIDKELVNTIGLRPLIFVLLLPLILLLLGCYCCYDEEEECDTMTIPLL